MHRARKLAVAVGLGAFLTTIGCSNSEQLSLDRFGGPPGIQPKVLDLGVDLGPDQFIWSATFSPNGRELHFVLADAISRSGTLMYLEERNGIWSGPIRAPFTVAREVCPVFTPDGRTLYFISWRDGVDIWTAKRSGTGWTEGQKLHGEVNTSAAEWEVSVTSDGTLYFNRQGLRRARSVDGDFPAVEELGPPLSEGAHEQCPFVAPDESYLIFTAERPEGYGRGDLYISFRGADDSWSEPKNLGPSINSPSNEAYPVISPPGRFLTFARQEGDIWRTYWVDAAALPRGPE